MTATLLSNPRAQLLATALLLVPLSSPVRTQQAVAQPNPSAEKRPADRDVSAPPSIDVQFLAIDEKGDFVRDLQASEVTLTDNGVPQKITYFAREQAPVSYGLVIDNSGSTRTILELLLRTAGSLVSANRAGDETFIMRFVSSKQISLLQGFTADTRLIGNALSEMYVEGGQTALVDAVYLAAEYAVKNRRTGDNRRCALVLITDGEDRDSHYRKEQLTKLLREQGVELFIIGLTGELDRAGGFIVKSPKERAALLLQTLASESGGRAFFPKPDVNALKAVVEEIADNLRAQYVVRYEPISTATDGKLHKIELKVADRRGKVRVRAVPQRSITPAELKEMLKR